MNRRTARNFTLLGIVCWGFALTSVSGLEALKTTARPQTATNIDRGVPPLTLNSEDAQALMTASPLLPVSYDTEDLDGIGTVWIGTAWIGNVAPVPLSAKMQDI